MADCVLLVISIALFGFVHCDDSKDEDDKKGSSSGLTLGQYAAIGIGGAVVLALIIIGIVALIIKCNKMSKASVQPTQGKHDVVTILPPREGVANKSPLYDDPPPMYSLRDQGPSNDVYLPPYSKTNPTTHAI